MALENIMVSPFNAPRPIPQRHETLPLRILPKPEENPENPQVPERDPDELPQPTPFRPTKEPQPLRRAA